MNMMLVTEEPGATVISEALAERLVAAGVRWAPLRYRVTGRQFPQKIRNLILLLFRARRFARGSDDRVVVGFLSMAGAYASVLRSLGFTRSVIVNFEPHSRYMKDMGLWREGSFKYRVTRHFEDRTVRNADVIIAPASAVVEHIRAVGSHAEIHEQGVTIDVKANARRAEEGRRSREQLGLEDRLVMVYVGKFNGIYHSEAQYMRFMERCCAADARIHHLVITFPEHVKAFEQHPLFATLQHRVTLHRPVAPEQLPGLLSAADLGVIAVPPTPSQIFRSPVKTALYWAAGLPIIIPKGVGDDWWLAEERRIGIAVSDLPTLDASELRTGIDDLLEGDRSGMRDRCVRAAFELRDTGLMVRLLRAAMLG